MQPQRSLFCRNTISVLFVVAALWVAAAAGSTERVLYSFAGGNDGALPTSALVADISVIYTERRPKAATLPDVDTFRSSPVVLFSN